MSKKQYAQILDFWSNEATYIDEMEIEVGLGNLGNKHSDMREEIDEEEKRGQKWKEREMPLVNTLSKMERKRNAFGEYAF